MKFESFQKIPRLNREVIVTEKLDGTNAQILIFDKNEYFRQFLEDRTGLEFKMTDFEVGWNEEKQKEGVIITDRGGEITLIRAGSRNRWLTEKQDNFGFWSWVNGNKSELVKLGVGRHYGEWWGSGIQRTYGLTEKRFWLFNTTRWKMRQDTSQHPFATVPQLGVVPILGIGVGLEVASECLDYLCKVGSRAVPDFMDPEGVVIYHVAANTIFKATCKNDEKGKEE